MENNEKIIVAQRVKKPLLKEAVLFIPMVFISLFVIVITPLINLFLNNGLLGFIQLNYLLIICVCAAFILVGTGVTLYTIKNNIKFNELPIDCIIYENDNFNLYGNNNLIIHKNQILDFKIKEEKIKLGLSKKETKIGNLILFVLMNSKKTKISVKHIYKVKNVELLLKEILKDETKINKEDNLLNDEENTNENILNINQEENLFTFEENIVDNLKTSEREEEKNDIIQDNFIEMSSVDEKLDDNN